MNLDRYGDLAVRVALNLQPGQRLLIIGPLVNGGVALEAAPLVHAVTAAAYRAGAELVEAIWGDQAMMQTRFREGRRESLTAVSRWLPHALQAHAAAGGALLSIYANDPDLLSHEPSDIVGALQQAVSRELAPFRSHISKNDTNWGVIAGAERTWAAKVFPDAGDADGVARLWAAIARLCRLDQPDPLAAWDVHLKHLAERSAFLNAKHYSALQFRGPSTDLRVGLPAGHVWVSGQSVSRTGIPFVANIPTEEVFTIADRARVDGTVRATKPLSYGGTMIEDFELTFKDGRVVALSAARGEAALRQLVSTDDGAGRLGEVALVPHGSPIAQSGLLFYNTLFDENAASHVALGTAYKFTLSGGETMDEDAFARAGGNRSAVHVDFMIGSGEVDVAGITSTGSSEPVMRAGEWVDSPMPERPTPL
ncbi:MAG TPA: aminopeptidase [Vicinamibacterales bacterium]|nr:aminopeptidase [Vicinamibacterales bacterium]